MWRTVSIEEYVLERFGVKTVAVGEFDEIGSAIVPANRQLTRVRTIVLNDD